MKKNIRLLIVDDDDDDRGFFIEAVKEVDNNIECIEVSNGEQALVILKDEKKILPDCIFLDLRMPGLGGKKCLEDIKETEKLKNIPVYIYTTSRDVEESRELMRLGAVQFISKPNKVEEIYYLVSCALEEQHFFSAKE